MGRARVWDVGKELDEPKVRHQGLFGPQRAWARPLTEVHACLPPSLPSRGVSSNHTDVSFHILHVSPTQSTPVLRLRQEQ